jgi:cardiolipin synthase
MLHAKTAVVDGHWSRVGSTNLNLASWVTNYELDVVVEDAAFAAAMQEMYLDDLEHATEIVLSRGVKVRPRERRSSLDRPHGSARERAGRAATGVLAIGSTVGAAIAAPRLLGHAEAPIMTAAAVVLLAVAAIIVLFPFYVSVAVAICCAWGAVILLVKAFRLRSLPEKMRDLDHGSTSDPGHTAG